MEHEDGVGVGGGGSENSDLFEPRACRGWNSQNGSPAKKLMMRAVEVRKEVPTVEEEREESRGEAVGEDG